MSLITMLMLGPILALYSMSVFGTERSGALFDTQLVFAFLVMETEIWGWRDVKRILWVSVLCRLLATGLLTAMLACPPGAHSFLTVGVVTITRNLYVTSLGSIAMGMYAAAVIVSYLKVRFNRTYLWLRLAAGQFIGVVTSLVVYLLMYYSVDIPLPVLTAAVWEWAVVAGIMTCALTPLCVVIVVLVKRAEGRDVFDAGVNYNPLSLE